VTVSRRLGSLLIVVCLLGLGPAPSLAQDGPVLEFILLGDIVGWPNHLGDDEPAVDVTLVPCRAFGQDLSDDYLKRWSRIYFPRTSETLRAYDVLFFNHPRLSFFTLLQQEMMVDFVGTEDRVSIAYPLSHYKEVQEPWLNSPISDAIPIDFDRFVVSVQRGLGQWDGYSRLRLEPDMPPVFTPFEGTGAFSDPIYEQFRPAYAKQGARIWIRGVNGPPQEPEVPAFVSWDYGDTEAWGFGIHPGTPRNHWQETGEWWELMFLNVCYYTRGEDPMIFDEALSRITVKSYFSSYRDSVSMFQNIVDFVSNMGANTAQAEETLTEAGSIKEEAEADYLDMEYESAQERMEEALVLASEAMDEATAAKDRALLWIYVSEWMATTAAAMVSGVLLWWLMVKRKLYREVKTTQLGSA